MVPTSSTPVRMPASSAGSPLSRSPFCSTTMREQAEHRAEDGAAPAEDRRAAEHHGGDRHQLVARARVRLRLPEVRDVDDRREARRESRQRRRPAPSRRPTGMPRSARPPANGRSRTARGRRSCGAAAPRSSQRRRHEDEQLRRDDAADVALAQRRGSRREAASSCSMPPVMPSAMPRNSESVPSVTMSGGKLEPRDQHARSARRRRARAAA